MQWANIVYVVSVDMYIDSWTIYAYLCGWCFFRFFGSRLAFVWESLSCTTMWNADDLWYWSYVSWNGIQCKHLMMFLLHLMKLELYLYWTILHCSIFMPSNKLWLKVSLEYNAQHLCAQVIFVGINLIIIFNTNLDD